MAGWIALTIAIAAPQAEPPLGIPVFAVRREGRCDYHVQDMIMDRSQMAKWFGQYPRTASIDVVEEAPTECARKVLNTLRAKGFRNIRIRTSSGEEYGPSPYFSR